MPGCCCAVYGCTNSYARLTNNGNTANHIRMFTFPGGNTPEAVKLREEWATRCFRQDDSLNICLKNQRVCSEHFAEEDYDRDLRSELLGLPTKLKLKKGALPTLKLPPKDSALVIPEMTEEVKEEDIVVFEFEREMYSTPYDIREEIGLSGEELLEEPPEQQPNLLDGAVVLFAEPDYETMYTELLEKYQRLQRNYKTLTDFSNVKIKRLNNAVRYYKIESNKLRLKIDLCTCYQVKCVPNPKRAKKPKTESEKEEIQVDLSFLDSFK
ncbi:uncharacterized protein LOC126745543 [Anthonomus grandis grandis]|uniref:uncharacterized protein LOC126745543 n=1 Tax=Anthonomus grandis grandis TaxID=2921223 RepID=UPI00216629C2|nr:uncharacterized protein LOC126745543 [Anthonomus grandis grandis]